MSDDTIKKYLYQKLKRTSVTVVILTPNAIEYETDCGKYDDWLYDELRYSLENRENNKTNAVVAIYTKEAENLLIKSNKHKCNICNKESDVSTILNVNNLVRRNMMNIKQNFKKYKCNNLFDSLEDSYISLVKYEDFKSDFNKYIDNAISKQDRIDQFTIIKNL